MTIFLRKIGQGPDAPDSRPPKAFNSRPTPAPGAAVIRFSQDFLAATVQKPP